jgi:hypothetical protein
MLGARGLVQEEFGLREDTLLAPGEQEPADLVGQGGSARLPGHDVGDPLSGEIFRQKAELRRLAGTLDPLERYERSPSLVHQSPSSSSVEWKILPRRELRRKAYGGFLGAWAGTLLSRRK